MKTALADLRNQIETLTNQVENKFQEFKASQAEESLANSEVVSSLSHQSDLKPEKALLKDRAKRYSAIREETSALFHEWIILAQRLDNLKRREDNLTETAAVTI